MNYAQKIRMFAQRIAGPSEEAQKLLIISWSAFPAKETGKTISMAGRELEAISEGWRRQIYRKGLRAYQQWEKDKAQAADLFTPPAKPVVYDLAEMRQKDPSNYPEDLPF